MHAQISALVSAILFAVALFTCPCPASARQAGAAAPTVAAAAGTTAEERPAIERAVGYYFAGLENSDVATLKRAFHPDAKLMLVRDGVFTVIPFPEWCERIEKGKANPNPGPPVQVTRRIVAVDSFGTSANVKVEARTEKATIVDFLNLLKVDGQWMIVNKIFHAQPR